MNRIRITKSFTFEMAHALWNYDGPCRNIHGHSYKLWVTVSGIPNPDPKHPKQGMVMDFGQLKSIVREAIIYRFDHSVVISRNAPHDILRTIEQMFDKYEITTYQPTCENLVIDFAGILMKKLPANTQLIQLKLQETETSYAEWFAADQAGWSSPVK